MGKTLIAGPWVGELGWEVARWVPAVRAAAMGYDRVVVVCRKGHEALYQRCGEDVVFEEYSPHGFADRWLCDGRKWDVPIAVHHKHPGATVFSPGKGVCRNGPFNCRAYYPCVRPLQGWHDATIIHARAILKADGSARNWGAKRWNALVEELRKRCPEKDIFAIGTHSGALCPAGCRDRRGLPLDDVISLLCTAAICIGTSSGPMHMASFCGCPHVVLTGKEYQRSIKGTNRDRYERLWNPFDTPVCVIDHDGWRPSVQRVVDAIGHRIARRGHAVEYIVSR